MSEAEYFIVILLFLNSALLFATKVLPIIYNTIVCYIHNIIKSIRYDIQMRLSLFLIIEFCTIIILLLILNSNEAKTIYYFGLIITAPAFLYTYYKVMVEYDNVTQKIIRMEYPYAESRKCNSCENYIIRERMWSINIYNESSKKDWLKNYDLLVCTDCCPTKDHINCYMKTMYKQINYAN